jgi:hypothetical protein
MRTQLGAGRFRRWRPAIGPQASKDQAVAADDRPLWGSTIRPCEDRSETVKPNQLAIRRFATPNRPSGATASGKAGADIPVGCLGGMRRKPNARRGICHLRGGEV